MLAAYAQSELISCWHSSWHIWTAFGAYQAALCFYLMSPSANFVTMMELQMKGSGLSNQYIKRCTAVDLQEQRAMKEIPDKEGKSYSKRLKQLNLESLKDWRKRGDTLQTYHTLRQFDDAFESQLIFAHNLRQREVMLCINQGQILQSACH